MSKWLLLIVLLFIAGCDEQVDRWRQACYAKGGIPVQVRGVKGTHHWMCVKEVP